MNSGQKSLRFVVLAACISGLSLPVAQSAPKKALAVGVVADRVEFKNGGCELLLSSDPSDPFGSERYVFMSDFNGRAVMNIVMFGEKRSLMFFVSPPNGVQPFFLLQSQQASGHVSEYVARIPYAGGDVAGHVDNVRCIECREWDLPQDLSPSGLIA